VPREGRKLHLAVTLIAYRELCDHEGWNAFTWVAIGRALGTLPCRRLLKRNGVRFVAYRLD
jgi:hypothetical protein